MDSFVVDFRHALRGLRRDRGFTLTAMVTLAIAIALNAIVVTVRDAMVVRGLPFVEQSDRLLYLAMRKPSDMACCPGPIRYADFAEWRAQTQAFAGLALGRQWRGGHFPRRRRPPDRHAGLASHRQHVRFA